MKLPLRRVSLVVAALALLALALWWFARPAPIVVEVREAERGRVEATIANTRAGTIEACQRTKLSTILGGRIQYLGVKEGDRVRKGQLLLKLWNEDQRAQLDLAGAQLEFARRRQVEACTVAAGAEREARRTGELRQQGFVSASKEDAARTDADAKTAACETAKADVRQGQARVASAKVEQGRVTLVAPFAGTVAKIVGEIGEYSTPSPPGVPTPPAIDLIDESCLYVNAPMDEVDAPRIKVGQAVRVKLDAFPKRDFPGRVRRVAPYVSAVEKQARTVDVEVDFAKPAEAAGMLVGYSADVEIVLAAKEDALRVPTASIREGGRVLVLRRDDGRLEERTLKTGLANWEYTEVSDGLAAGERVVTSLEKEGVKPGVAAVAASSASTAAAK
jgi:HlyD family secretion protein